MKKLISMFCLVSPLLATGAISCIPELDEAQKYADIKGNWQMAVDANERMLGPSDKNASYIGFMANVREGDRITVRGRFPHCRYISYMVYDENFMPVDSIRDVDIEPEYGVNPFRPGVERDVDEFGTYRLQVLMTPPPEGGRPPNTLYAGRNGNGGRNKCMVLAYRIYLPDKGYGIYDGHPLGLFAGVEAPEILLLNEAGSPYRQGDLLLKTARARLFGSILRANRKKLRDPEGFIGPAINPVRWMNNASRLEQRKSTVVPNDETSYIAASISSEYGELLVLRWKPAVTPVGTYHGKPFPEKYDMRYWSLSTAYVDESHRVKMFSEKTVADVFAPTLPDGTKQLVIGFGGMERPASVPADQWLGMTASEGFLIVRNIAITPGWAGDFGQIPAGPISPEYDKYTPGGVYCSVAELGNNPDIGLTRADIYK